MSVFDRLDVASAGVGALVAYQAIQGTLAYFFIIPTRLGYLLGPHAESILLAVGVLSGAALGFLAVRLGGYLALYIFLGVADEIADLDGKEEKARPPPSYVLPSWPKRQGPFQLVLGGGHRLDGRFTSRPGWYVLPCAPALALVCGLPEAGGNRGAVGRIVYALSRVHTEHFATSGVGGGRDGTVQGCDGDHRKVDMARAWSAFIRDKRPTCD